MRGIDTPMAGSARSKRCTATESPSPATVTDSAVNVPVCASRSCNSLNQGLLVATTGVAVSVPPGPVPVTVSATVVVRDVVPEVAVNVTVAAPSVAVLDAVNVAVTELPWLPSTD